jgi:hypothetical protein
MTDTSQLPVFYLIGRESSGGGYATDRGQVLEAVLSELEYEPAGDYNPMTEEAKADVARQLNEAKVGDTLEFRRVPREEDPDQEYDTITVELEQHEPGWLETLPEFEGW